MSIAKVTLTVRFANGDTETREVNIDEKVFGIDPLPVNREVPGCHHDQARAQEQREHRRFVATEIADEFAYAFLKTVEGRDTINGYTKAQIRMMTGADIELEDDAPPIGGDRCRHGNRHGDSDTCDHGADIAYDEWRETQ